MSEDKREAFSILRSPWCSKKPINHPKQMENVALLTLQGPVVVSMGKQFLKAISPHPLDPRQSSTAPSEWDNND